MTDYQVCILRRGQAALVPCPFDPEPRGDELVGENLLSLISTGSERGGITQDFSNYPIKTGSSSIARVTAVGKDVTGFAPGDLVYHSGPHARYVKMKAGDAIPVPEGAKPEHAIFGRYAAVSMTSIFRMRAKPVDQVIVTGLGMVGVMCAAVLQAFGFRVYAVGHSGTRRENARAAGIPYVGESLEALGVARQGCGALMECSGNETALRDAIPYLRRGAEVFQIGVPWQKRSDWDAHDLLYQLFYAYISIHGGWEWSIPWKDDDFHIHSSCGHIRSAMEMIAGGQITIPDTMYDLRSPAECAGIYAELAAGSMEAVSVMLDWRQFREEQV